MFKFLIYCVSIQKKNTSSTPTTNKSEMFGPNVADKYALAVTNNLGLTYSFWPCSAGPLWLQIPIQYYYINFLKMSTKLQKDLSRLCCLSYWKSVKYFLFQVRLFWTFNDISPISNSKTFVASTLKSVHFKKTVARISFLSKLWYFLFWFVLKVPQFWKKRDSRNCLLKMNGL